MADLGVVIPTLGRQPEVLERVLTGLERQDPPGASIEVTVVVDAAASDPTLAEEVAARRTSLDLRVLRGRIPGAAANRNLGWQHSDAPIVLFLDDDVIPTAPLLAAHVSRHRRHPEVEVGVLGLVRWAPELRVTPFMKWLEDGVQFDFGGIEGEEAGWGRFYTPNVSVKREILERVGGFDQERLPYLYEDLDLGYRMSKHGFRLLYAPEAVGHHLHPTTLERWRQRIRGVGASERRFLAIHPGLRPHFYELFSHTSPVPRKARLARLARFVPPSTPVLGTRVWRSADVAFRQALRGPFMEGWEQGESPPQRTTGAGSVR